MNAARANRWPRLLLPLFFACAFWLNQGVPRARFLTMLETIKASPKDHVALAAWYPLAFLYHRAIDEQMYFETAGAILGRSTDRQFMREVRGKVPASFERELPAADGKWHAPYTEVPIEYPPAVVPFLVLPRLVTDDFATYARLFGLEMALFMTGALALVLAAVEGTGETENDLRRRATWAALFALAEGSLVIQRLDAIATFFLALAFYGAVKRKPLLLGIAGGGAFAVKFLPALVLPVLLAADAAAWKNARAWLVAAAGSIVTVAALLGPIALAPGAFAAMLAYHADRGLQVESTFAALLGAVRTLTGSAVGSAQSFGSANLQDPLSLGLARACTPLTLAAIAGVATLAFRSGKRAGSAASELARVDRMARALAGATVLVWLLSKVLSPQYLTWGLPLILAIPWSLDAKARRPAWAFLAALAVTQIYMRAYYESVAGQEPIGVVTLLVRQGLLGALAWWVLAPLAAVVHVTPHDRS